MRAAGDEDTTLTGKYPIQLLSLKMFLNEVGWGIYQLGHDSGYQKAHPGKLGSTACSATQATHGCAFKNVRPSPARSSGYSCPREVRHGASICHENYKVPTEF